VEVVYENDELGAGAEGGETDDIIVVELGPPAFELFEEEEELEEEEEREVNEGGFVTSTTPPPPARVLW
jgi:hypothetical protein